MFVIIKDDTLWHECVKRNKIENKQFYDEFKKSWKKVEMTIWII